MIGTRLDRAVLLTSLSLFLLLVAMDISGSSIGRWQDQFPAKPSGVLAGEARSIRSDEWMVGTPLAVGQAKMGSPAHAFVGTTDMTFDVSSYAAPSKSYGVAFRPQTWGYLMLSPSRGLAWQWWAPLLLAFVGLFAMFRLSRLGPWSSVTLAVLGSFTPYVAWWSLWPDLAIGFGACASAAFLLAVRSRRWVFLVGLSLVAGWFAVCLVLFLYPPWTIPGAYILGAAVLGSVIDGRVPWRRAVCGAVIAGATGLVSTAVWFALHREAISAFANTVYPGQRRLASGGGDSIYLFGAFANPLLSLDLPLAYGNLSEASSSFVFAPLAAGSIAVIVVLAGPLRRTGRVPFIAPILVFLTGSVLLVWALVPGIPGGVGALLLLDRIPASRLPLALGLGAVLVIGYAIPVLRERVVSRSQSRDWGLVAAVTMLAAGGLGTVVISARAAMDIVLPGALRNGHYVGPNELPVLVGASALVIVGSLVLLQIRRLRLLAGVVIITYAIGSFALVNPVQHGLGPLGDLPPTVAQGRVAVFGPAALSDIPRMRGQEVVSGTAIYPNPSFWQSVPSVDPFVWNRYVQWNWQPKSGAPPMEATLSQADSAVLYADPCGSPVRALGAGFLYSISPLYGDCLEPRGTEMWGTVQVYVYQRR